jgi:hypothetical protein
MALQINQSDKTMSTNKIFNSRRFVNLIKNDLLINYKTYLITFAGSGLLMYLIMLILMLDKDRNFGISDYSGILLVFLIGLAGFVGSAFPSFNSKHSGNSYLLLPGSAFEKYFQQFLFRVVLGTALYLAIYWLTAQLARFTALNTELVKDSGIFIEKFSFSLLFNNNNDDVLGVKMIQACITVGIFIFSFRLNYRQMAAIRSFFAFIGIVFLIMLYLVILSHMIFPNTTEGFDISHHMTFEIQKTINQMSVSYLLLGCSWLIMLIYGYLKLKEKEA